CPATVLIDRKGRIVGRSNGEGDWTGESARAAVRTLLGIAPGPSAVSVAPTKRARKAVHLVSAVAPNDSKLIEILNEAADSLKVGDEVVILFDGRSVGALRTSGPKIPLEDVPFTKKQRRAVAQRLGVSESSAPRNQFEYIQHLAKLGAKVLVNTNAMRAL